MAPITPSATPAAMRPLRRLRRPVFWTRSDFPATASSACRPVICACAVVVVASLYIVQSVVNTSEKEFGVARAGGDVARMGRLLPKLVIERITQKKAELGDRMTGLRIDGLND